MSTKYTINKFTGLPDAIDNDGGGGTVGSVDNVPPDAQNNVPLTRIFDTEEAFNLEKDSLPTGTRVVKLYEYPDNLADVLPVPDYTNQESQNLWENTAALVSVQRTGWYRVSATITVTTAGQSGLWVMVNGKTVTSGYNANPAVNDYIQVTELNVLVKKGDVFSINKYANSSYIGTWLNYNPTVLVEKELPIVVEKNGSYSLDEIKTSDKWLDGRPIYKKTFNITYSTTTAITVWHVYPVNARKLIKFEGIHDPTSVYIGMSNPNYETLTGSSEVNIGENQNVAPTIGTGITVRRPQSSNTIEIGIRSGLQENATPSGTFSGEADVTVYYTKIAD
jgi:hypothetical protein